MKEIQEMFTYLIEQDGKLIHNKDRRSPYYDEWVSSSTRGAVDIYLRHATKRSFSFALHFRDVGENFAIDWCRDYFARFNMRMCDSVDIDPSEKGWFSVEASVPTEDVCKYYNIEID